MGRPTSSVRRVVVEDCEVVKANDALRCLRLGFRFDTGRTRGHGRRLCLLCPLCDRTAFKLTGRFTRRCSRVELATISAIRAYKSMTHGFTGS